MHVYFNHVPAVSGTSSKLSSISASMVPGDVSVTEAQTVTLVPSSPVTTAVDTLTVASEVIKTFIDVIIKVMIPKSAYKEIVYNNY